MSNLETITLQLPVDLVRELATAEQSLAADLLQRGLRDLRLEQALSRYREGNISFGAAAVLAGLSQSDFAMQAYAHGFEPPFSDETLAEELAL